MGLVNGSLQPHRALICVDTMAARADEPNAPHYEGSTLVTLPHAGIVFAVRGVTTALDLGRSAANSPLGSFDEIAETVPKALRLLPKAVRKIRPWPWPKVQLGRQEVAMVGYYDQEQRVRCVHFTTEDCKEFNRYELEAEDSMTSPWDQRWGEPLCVDTVEAMRRASIAQIVRARDLYPKAPVGGRLLLVELSKGRMTQTVLHTGVKA